MVDFFKWIEDLELHEHILIRGKYTWVGGLNHQSNARFDRFLYSTKWEESFNNTRQRIMPRVTQTTTLSFWSVETAKKEILISNLKIDCLRSRVLMNWSKNSGVSS